MSDRASPNAKGSRLSAAALSLQRHDDQTLVLVLSGDWTLDNEIASASELQARFESVAGVQRVVFDTGGLGAWDSSLLILVTRIIDLCSGRRVEVLKEGLPPGARRLLSLASATPERAGARKGDQHPGILAHLGEATIDLGRSMVEVLAFIGECAAALGRLLAGRARFRKSDLFLAMQTCGAQALPIVSLISILVGVILAFVGAIQLRVFGAQLYVASLVGIAMVRVMGAVMTGIIMAGRTGAAFAAQLGTMQVNEEIDSLKTLGLQPMDFLVLPRLLALFLMMPLLCLYADLMGILGGLVVGVGMLDLGAVEYLSQTRETVKLNDLWIGLFHGAVFGVLIAVAGCLRGMQSGRSASAVGNATTSAVVTSIVSIIAATALITVACNVLGI
ncbi:MAG TPA: ABC transporter permease [Anaeromyxobacteraceae bacterium]|nr:ABC transporter permease [Anaeromyxobacteraceae bacterium]